MRLEKIQTTKTVAKPQLVRESNEYKVLDINGVERKVFEDIDVARAWMKRHNTELTEGTEPVVYMSEIMEGVLDDTDDDGWMAKSELYKLAKYAITLHGMIQDTDNLEPWVASKITKASDYISTVKHYMEYVHATEVQPEIIDDLPDQEI
jgi:hypothetical protein